MRFGWHPAARVVDAAGGLHGPQTPADRPVVLAPVPGVVALQAALGAPAFRIGGDGPPPEGAGLFETLTGGTSGTPRRILRAQASWIASFTQNARLFGIGPGVAVAVLGQLVHSLALYGAVEALHLGATLHLLDGVRPDRQARALAERRIALVYATPAQMRALVAAGVDWPDLRQVIIGGAKLDPALRAELQTRSPAQVVEFYGAAETSFISLSDAATPPDSVGRPYPGVEIEDRDGLLWVRSPYLAQGYAGVPGSALWQDGWVCPGEIGHLAEGYLYLTGRAGRRVKIADQTVQPEEIEALILSLPGVQAAAVLPQPDARRGVVLVACLQGDVTAEGAILARLRRDLGPLKAPRRIVWVAEWPVLPSGKTDLQALAGVVA
ncbi:AMP-dependent synthetase [Gemmobacter lanyuensis]|uniref:AMP-dependent synthetase n=1 Tax=Gemmobacter lanyuensis TaxID=1054497 RepID=A0A918IWZ9_9RHOB|nr:AMP-binding protein [Gemmobacter lanyuensis]GGW36265.1 AMP-dependent synthetase [Gemmobacter lanyuensis]